MTDESTAKNLDDVPAGFEPVELRGGFKAVFGRIYLHPAKGCLAFRVREHLLNPVGVCHGGAIATFADMQIAVVKSGFGDLAGHYPTIHLDVDYLAPAPLGAWVEMTATLVKATRRLLFTQAMIAADGECVARSTGIYRNRTRPDDGQKKTPPD